MEHPSRKDSLFFKITSASFIPLWVDDDAHGTSTVFSTVVITNDRDTTVTNPVFQELPKIVVNDSGDEATTAPKRRY